MTGEREALIEAIERALQVPGVTMAMARQLAERATTAALSVRGTAPCPACRGKRRVVHEQGSYEAGAQISIDCPSCNGSGSVDTGPLLVTREEHEAALELLRYMAEVEDQPCRLDHHGYCQEHPGGWREPECFIAAARKLVALRPHPEGEAP